MMNAPVPIDTQLFETLVRGKQVTQIAVGVRYVIYTRVSRVSLATLSGISGDKLANAKR
jgi:hypothetical protein